MTDSTDCTEHRGGIRAAGGTGTRGVTGIIVTVVGGGVAGVTGGTMSDIWPIKVDAV